MYNKDMDRKSKILLYIFFILFFGTVFLSYARYMILYDFEVVSNESEENETLEEPVIDTGSVSDEESVLQKEMVNTSEERESAGEGLSQVLNGN
jgi:hypothetical protein